MSKVFLLILSGVSFLPIAAFAMEEGDNPEIARQFQKLMKEKRKGEDNSGSPEEAKGKEKELNKPALQRTDRILHMSQVDGAPARRRVSAPSVKQENKGPRLFFRGGRFAGLEAQLNVVQDENAAFIEKIKNLTLKAPTIQSLFASRSAGGETDAVEVEDGVWVNLKQILRVTTSIESAVAELYVNAFFNETHTALGATAVTMDKFFKSNSNCESIYRKVIARFDGNIVIGKYDGETAQTRRAEQDENVDGKVLSFQLMVKDPVTKKYIDLMYPFADFKDNLSLIPAKMTLSVTFNEVDKSNKDAEKIK